MNPREFVKLAARLAGGSSAAEHRTSIGRSYYGAFNVAADHLRSLGFSIRSGASAHGEVGHCLANAGDEDVRAIAADLGELHSKRNRADYQLDKTDVEKPTVSGGIAATTEAMIQTLDALFRGPQRAQIKSAIAQWRRENGYP